MGNKSIWAGKHFFYYLAVIILTCSFGVSSCAPVQESIAEFQAHRQLEENREKLAAGFFDNIIEQCLEVIKENETEPPADVAFYILGEVYAHHDYPGRDYSLSRKYFEKLIANFPDSTLTSEAETYISLFDNIAAREEEAKELDQKMKLMLQEKPVTVTDEETISVPSISEALRKRNFAEAEKSNLQLLEKVGRNKPADEALYNLGLIYAHVDNPAKDYKKAQIYFHVLTKQFPKSERAEEAKIWLGLFATIEKIQQIDIEIEQQKKQLNR